MTTITSSFLSLNIRDIIHGLIMAVGGAVLGIITGSLQTGNLTFNYTAIWHAAATAAVVYLGKKFFTPSQQVKPVQ